jgi:membrane protease YdiL (CAAX protease family)
MSIGSTSGPVSQPPPGAPTSGQESLWTEPADDRPPWSATTGVAGLLLALLAIILLVMLVGALVGVTLALTSRIGQLRASQFGFRPSKGSAIRWALAVLFGYFLLAYLYTLLASPPEDDLPQELGANESTTLAIITGIFVIGIAPVVEEFFFRGFLYQAFRNGIGVWGAAAASGLIFGVIHFKPEFLVPLAGLGVLLALLFQKTGSLWPCIAVHAINNALAFAVLL